MSETAREYTPARSEPRLGLLLPVLVTGHAPGGTVLEDEGLMQDVCGGGMAFRTTLPLRKGQVVHLQAAVPRGFRKYGLDARSYAVFAIVRSVLVDDEGSRVGVLFFGQEPPSGYQANPAACYELPDDVVPGWAASVIAKDAAGAAAELRHHPRFPIFVDFALERVDEWGAVLEEERTVADNVSHGGARVYTTHSFQVGEVVQVRESAGSFAARARVVGSFRGPDGVRRLNLHFLDGREPRHLVPGH
jgi:hypothetical protein